MKIKIPFFNKPKPREIYEPSQIDFLLTEGIQSSPHNALPWWRKKQKIKDEWHINIDEISTEFIKQLYFMELFYHPDMFK